MPSRPFPASRKRGSGATQKRTSRDALPAQPGPWLILSSGGEDGAFGAGLLNGLTAAGKRPEYSVVTGVSTGALIAPFAFAGPRYDDALRDAFTKVTAADIYEAGRSGESFVDSWPLRDFIAKEITPELFADIATAHRSGRRLFVASYNLDAERAVIWNMGAIAAHGGKDALDLFRSVLLASTAIPGGFPPVLIDVEADGKRFQEMHVDGGLGGQLFVAPAPLMESTSDYRVPATELYIVVNSGLERDFKVVERFAPSILTQAVGAAVKVDTRLMLDRALIVAKRSGVPFNVATIPANFSAPSKGPFDPGYMGPLFQTGYDLGKSQSPFKTQPPPYSAPRLSHRQTTLKKPERINEPFFAPDPRRCIRRVAGGASQCAIGCGAPAQRLRRSMERRDLHHLRRLRSIASLFATDHRRADSSPRSRAISSRAPWRRTARSA